MEKGIRQEGPRAERLFRAALDNAYAYIGEGWNRGKGLRALRAPLHRVFDRLIFSKIREGFGGRLEFFIGGAAYLDIDMQRFFFAIGIPMYQGYGLTEAAPIISANTPTAHKLGTSGKIVPNLEVRICDEDGRDLPPGEKGEIVVRGENVMAGYWRNEEATAAAIRDGWLHTGDLGRLDSDGYLHVLGRVKSLLINGTGEKYSPEGIEEALVSGLPFIEQVMLHNDHDPYTVALIVPNREALRDWLGEEGLSCHSEEGQRDGHRALPGRDRCLPEGGIEGRALRERVASCGLRHPRGGVHGREPPSEQLPEDGATEDQGVLPEPVGPPLSPRRGKTPSTGETG